MTNFLGEPTKMRHLGAVLRLVLFMVCAGSLAFAITPDVPRIEAESMEQELRLGAAFLTGRGVARDEKQAAYWYEKAANAGDPAAEEQIGYFYLVGIGVPRDPVRATHWYALAVAGGSISAKVCLGVAYIWGIGVRKDVAFAADLFRQAAERGDGTGAAYLGDMYYFGALIPKDTAVAEHWYEVGAKLHDPQSEFRLAEILSNRQSANRDLKKEASLLRDASSKGFVPAKHALGLMLVNHPNLASTPQEAIESLGEAAEAGTWKSSAVLGILARDGRGVAADPRIAYFHFRVAELQGGKNASNLLANDLRLQSGKLTSAEIEQANRDAADWLRKHPIALQFVYKDGARSKYYPAYALTTADNEVHAGYLIPTPFAQRE